MVDEDETLQKMGGKREEMAKSEEDAEQTRDKTKSRQRPECSETLDAMIDRQTNPLFVLQSYEYLGATRNNVFFVRCQSIRVVRENGAIPCLVHSRLWPCL